MPRPHVHMGRHDSLLVEPAPLIATGIRKGMILPGRVCTFISSRNAPTLLLESRATLNYVVRGRPQHSIALSVGITCTHLTMAVLHNAAHWPVKKAIQGAANG